MASLTSERALAAETTTQDAKLPSATNSAGARLSKAELRNRRLAWNRDTLVGDYERHGIRNSKWDPSAIVALELFAKIRTDGTLVVGELQPKVRDAVGLAVTNGCDDPMVKYLYVRYLMPTGDHNSQDHAEAFRAVADAMVRGDRSPIRKYYAALRASEFANMGTAAAIPEVQRWRAEAKRFLAEVVNDTRTPPGEVYDALETLLQSIPKNRKERYEPYLALEPVIFKNWPLEAQLYQLKGWIYTDYAWEARGTAYADAVTDEGWDGFGKRLEIAEQALNKGWELDPKDPRIARWMLTVELGQGRGRPRMEQWFQRAMALDSNYYDACYAKLYYLEPKWHGSREDMFEFASECLRSEKWGGHVPLIVIDAHEDFAKTLQKGERAEYWKRPEVWRDLKQAFDKFFRLNPNDSGWHHNYALYAYRAEQWEDLNRQIALLGNVNYSYFGGRQEYDTMVRLAREHSVQSPSKH